MIGSSDVWLRAYVLFHQTQLSLKQADNGKQTGLPAGMQSRLIIRTYLHMIMEPVGFL